MSNAMAGSQINTSGGLESSIASGGAAGTQQCVKFWNYSSLLQMNYSDWLVTKITGGYVGGVKAPKKIPILVGGQPYTGAISAVSYTSDNQYLAVGINKTEIMLYKLGGNL